MINCIKNLSLSVVIFSVVNLFFSVGNSQSLEVSFIGNEAMRITDQKHVLLTDFPYISGAFGYMEYEFDFTGERGNILSLITHNHDDHFSPDIFKKQPWKIVGPDEATSSLSPGKVIKRDAEIKFGAINIYPRKTEHGDKEHYSYLVKWHGKNLLFTGDADKLATLANLPELDALFISPWLYGTALRENKLPITKKIIIYHHEDGEIIKNCENCLIPKQNQVFTID